ncbi:VOC family protein [Mucilaginibacter sp. 14171R-50]|uniref:VOC family protein n=1 Tax=Mucilaginibacter sp. 14171R-50 TaxID=2703789 RepID=UPI00138C1CC8|nr:VOC family protein [Mucilaginibacter sp. 14171R-50]QHS54978.1 VOC family protein [Mucilaginibacter sp. 14171R-50]
MATQVVFAPMLIIPNGITDVSFYTRAFGAEELRRFSNDDGTIHVVELSMGGAMFHIHEQWETKLVSPQKAGASTVSVNIFVEDVDTVVEQAVAAGAKITSPVQDFDYGLRQGDIIDPFGHCWQIQKKI